MVVTTRPSGPLHHDGRPSPRFPRSSSSLPFPSLDYTIRGGHSHCPFVSPITPGKEDYQGGFCRPAPVFLQGLCGDKEGWPVSLDHRSVQVERASGNPYISNGICAKNRTGHCRGTLGLHNRSQRCLFSCSDGLGFSPLPSVLSGWESFPFPIPSFRSLSGSVGLSQDYQTCDGLPPQEIRPNTFLSGRLLEPAPYSRGSQVKHRSRPVSVSATGHHGELQEVVPHSFTECGVSGRSPPFGQVDDGIASIHCSEDNISVRKNTISLSSVPSVLRKSDGSSQFCSSFGASGKTSAQTSDHVDEQPFFCVQQGRSDSSGQSFQRLAADLAVDCLPESLGPYVDPCPPATANDRCLTVWLERGSSTIQGFGSLAGGVSGSVNQLAGTSGGVPGSSAFPLVPQRSQCAYTLRQHYGSVLPVAPGDVTIRFLNGPFSTGLGVLLLPLHPSSSQIPSGFPERVGRQWLTPVARSDGVGTGWRDLPVAVFTGRAFSSGPFRDPGQREAPVFCVSVPRSSGGGGECPVPPVGRVGEDLSFPSRSSAQGGGSSPPSLLRQGPPCGPLLCSIRLVPQSPDPLPSTSSSSSFSLPFSSDQQRQGVSPESVCLLPSRVAFMRVGLAATGFDEPTVLMTLRAHRGSTTRQYQSVWKLFRSFVSGRGLSLGSVPKRDLLGLACNFLRYASTVLHRQYRTVTTYRSALRHPLFITCGVDIRNVFSDLLLRGIFNACPPQRAKPMPAWSLNDVLSFLDGPLFEPLETASPTRLLQKTLFLLFLATGRRVGEVSALSRLFSKQGDCLVLECVQGFFPKHFTPAFRPLPPVLHYFNEDPLVSVNHCPVRAFLMYVQVSANWLRVSSPHGRNNLWFLPKSKKPLSVTQISGIFRSLVTDCLICKGASCDVPISPHQMRKFAASYAKKVGQDEETVRVAMGFSSVSILRKNYTLDVPLLLHPCVLPGGSFSPGYHSMSSSDSD